MIKECLAYLFDRGAEGAVKIETPFEEDGYTHPYAVGHGKAVALDWPDPEPFIAPDSVDIRTLSGLVRVLMANVDDWDLQQLVVKCDHYEVVIWGPLEGATKNRPDFVRACYQGPCEDFDNLRVREFRLAVMVCFEDTPERARLLAASEAFKSEGGNTREEGVSGMGLSFTESKNRLSGVRTEISQEEMVFRLSPFRSFPEAGAQQVVPFILTIDGQEGRPPTGTLTDCGANAWEAPAARQVGQHVEKLLKEAEIPSPVVW